MNERAVKRLGLYPYPSGDRSFKANLERKIFMDSVKNPFEPFFDEVRRIVREEIAAATNGNGHALLTADELAKMLKVNKATVYEWVKAGTIPFYQAGRFVRFNLSEVLESQKKTNGNPIIIPQGERS